jgi:hypothetical protein
MDDGNGVIFNVVFIGLQLEFVATNLTSGVGYSFKVSAVNFNGEGTVSSTSIIESCIVPSGVQAPTLVSSTSTSIDLRWTQPLSNGGCSILSYAIFRDDGMNGNLVNNMNPEIIANNPYLFEYNFVLPASLTGLNVRFVLQATN